MKRNMNRADAVPYAKRPAPLPPSDEVHYGSRGDDFKKVIVDFLKKGRLKQEYINVLTDAESMVVWSAVLTSKSADPLHNYELYEILGDGVVNQALVFHLVRRFPEFNSSEAVPVISRLKINMVSRESFQQLNWDHLHFWPFISAQQEVRISKKKQLLEDTFEAAFGALVLLVDGRIRQGAGFSIAYNIMHWLLSKMQISLAYEDLVDPKTRLKETLDAFKSSGPTVNGRRLPPLDDVQYVNNRNPADKVHYVTITRGPSGVLGHGSAHVLKDAEQQAATQALATLKEQGYYNAPRDTFAKFCRY